MKIALSFISGVIVCGLMLIGVRTVMPTQAETTVDGTADNVTGGLLDLLPDIEQIYRQSLVLPFQKAAAKIYDPDIAEFYSDLLDATGLSEPVEEPENFPIP